MTAWRPRVHLTSRLPTLRVGMAWRMMLLVCLGLVFSALIPPLQSPDEPSHVVRAYLLSKGQWLLEAPPSPDVGSGGYVDDGLVHYGGIYQRVTAKPDKRLTERDIAEADVLTWRRTLSYVGVEGTGYYLPIAYLPQAMAFFVGEHLELTIDHTYRLARLLAFLASIATIAAAFRLCPPNPLMVMLLILPMSAFQFVSASLDGWATALAVLAVALFLRGMDTQYSFSRGMLYLLAACLLIVASSRAQLLPLTVLPLFVYYARRDRAALACFAVTALLSLAWTLFAIKTTVVGPLRPSMAPGVVEHYLRNPLDFAVVLARTLGDEHTFEFYLRSFVGILGWLDTALPDWLYVGTAYALGAAALLSLSARSLSRDWVARAVLLVLALGASLLVFLALLINWTPHPATLIAGVQGRYFLVPALLFAFALSGHDDGLGGIRRLPSIVLLTAYGGVAGYATTQALLLRFYAVP